MSATAVRNPIEIRKAGLRALNDALGYDGAQAFLLQFSGTGDFARERKESPEPSHEEVMADIYRLQDEYARGLIDIAGRPIPDSKMTVAKPGDS